MKKLIAAMLAAAAVLGYGALNTETYNSVRSGNRMIVLHLPSGGEAGVELGAFHCNKGEC